MQETKALNAATDDGRPLLDRRLTAPGAMGVRRAADRGLEVVVADRLVGLDGLARRRVDDGVVDGCHWLLGGRCTASLSVVDLVATGRQRVPLGAVVVEP